MKLSVYSISFFALFMSLKSFSDIIINPPASEEEKKDEPKDTPPVSQEIVKEPTDVRNQLNINVLNSSGKNLFFYTKIRAATQQEGVTIQPWEYIKIYTFVKESATLATFHGGPGAKYEYERSRLHLHEKDADNKDTYLELECKLAPSAAGKVASKSVVFIVGKEPGEDVISCLVYYDKG